MPILVGEILVAKSISEAYIFPIPEITVWLSRIDFIEAVDFVRIHSNKKYQVYHHIGIYAFTNKALMRYVNLKRSKLELERKLEQLRAMENDMSIHVGYINSSPLSVDTEKDLLEVKKLMEKNEKN